MENYLAEAFQKLSLLKEDDFDITADRDVVDELKSFVADDVEEIPEEPVIDLDAESEDELADNYVGKVILECECCHTRLYKEEAEVFVDEESGLANVDEECPVCNNAMGYTVIGKIEKFDEEPVEDEEDDEIDFSDAENEPADEAPVESLRDRLKKKAALKEAKEDVCPECGQNPCVCEKCDEGCEGEECDEACEGEECDEACDSELKEATGMDALRRKYGGKAKTEACEEAIEEELNLDDVELKSEDSVKLEDPEQDPVLEESLNEDIENISVDTDDTHLDMTTNEDGGVDIHTSPIDKGAEEIVPLSDEEQDEILANEPEGEEDEFPLDDLDFEMEPEEGEFEEEPLEGEEEEEEEIAEESWDINDFDEHNFNDLCESYLRKVYENVNTFETTAIRDQDDQLVVEGIIKFKNDKQMKSSFVFTEANETKSGRIVLEGYNATFSNQPKSFKVKGSLKNNNYIAESMSYNYTVKNLVEGQTEKSKVFGRVRVVK